VTEILVVWESDPLCHLPVERSDEAARVARELGHACHRSSRDGVLVVNSPFAGRQVALIVEEGRGGMALGEALGELLVDTSARVNLVRFAGPNTPLPPGGHLLLWLAEGAENSPLTIVPGKYYGSARLASLLHEELSSASRLTPGTDVLFMEGPRQTCPSSLPAVVIECPPAAPQTLLPWAAGLKRGLARHFSGEGTSLSSGSAAGGGGMEAVQDFWRRLKEVVPAARLTAAAGMIFSIGDDSSAAAAPPPATAAVPQKAPKGQTLAKPLMSQRPAGVSPASFGRRPPVLPPPPPPGFRYPASPYPVSMAPFVRPIAPGVLPQDTKPFTRPRLGAVIPQGTDAAPSAGEADPACAPGSPLR